MRIGIILTSDERSKAYLQKSIQNNIMFDEIIFLNDNREEKQYLIEEINISKTYGFDISISVKSTLTKRNLKYMEFNFVDINHSSLIDYVRDLDVDFLIFTGGGILRHDILNCGKKFVHLHPGIVPEYRGSTCFYYSIIKDNECGVTVFEMNEGIDTGSVIYQKTFEKPNNPYLDHVYDPYIRSDTLMEVLLNNILEKENFKKQNPNEGETYFVIHPILKHIAILSCIKKI